MSGVKELAYVVYEASDLAAWRHFACDPWKATAS